MNRTVNYIRTDFDKRVNRLAEQHPGKNGPHELRTRNHLAHRQMKTYNPAGLPFRINEYYNFEIPIRKYYPSNPRFKPKCLLFMRKSCARVLQCRYFA